MCSLGFFYSILSAHHLLGLHGTCKKIWCNGSQGVWNYPIGDVWKTCGGAFDYLIVKIITGGGYDIHLVGKAKDVGCPAMCRDCQATKNQPSICVPRDFQMIHSTFIYTNIILFFRLEHSSVLHINTEDSFAFCTTLFCSEFSSWLRKDYSLLCLRLYQELSLFQNVSSWQQCCSRYLRLRHSIPVSACLCSCHRHGDYLWILMQLHTRIYILK